MRVSVTRGQHSKAMRTVEITYLPKTTACLFPFVALSVGWSVARVQGVSCLDTSHGSVRFCPATTCMAAGGSGGVLGNFPLPVATANWFWRGGGPVARACG